MRSLRLVAQAIDLAERHGLVELEVPGLVRLVRRPLPPPKPETKDGEEQAKRPAPVPVSESEAFKRWERGEGIR